MMFSFDFTVETPLYSEKDVIIGIGTYVPCRFNAYPNIHFFT